MADNVAPRPQLTTARLVLHVAPALLAWVYFALILAGTESDWVPWRWYERLYVLQLVVAVLAFGGALFATRLPASKAWRVLLIIASLLVALALAGTRVTVFDHCFPRPI